MKACFMEIAKLYDSSNGVVSIGTLLTKCEENEAHFSRVQRNYNGENMREQRIPTKCHISTNSSHKRNASLRTGLRQIENFCSV